MSEKIPFRPVVGKEEKILNSTLHEGVVAFATDTKKIYYNDGQTNIPMGGNSGIYYANRVWEETPEAGQIEFYFFVNDIENQEVPNIDDLILNVPDGSFFRVVELQYDSTPMKIKTNRLTLAGGGGGENIFGQVTINKIGNGASGRLTTLYQSDCELGVKINAIDAEGLPIGVSGTYKVTVGGLVKITKNIDKSEVYFNVGPYLNIGENTVRIELTIETDLGYTTTLTAKWTVAATEVKLTWDYSDTVINRLENPLKLDYSVTGLGVEKTLHFIVNGIDLAEGILEPFIGETANKPFIIQNLKAYGFSHGVYKAEMYVTANIDGKPFRGQSTIYNLIFVEQDNDNTIISCNFYEDNIIQYNTFMIPIVAYSSANLLNDLSLDLIEDGTKVGSIDNVANAQIYSWAYTPTTAGLKTLVVQSGAAQTSITITVLPLDIKIEEVPSAVYNFKANSFANSEGVKNWTDSNGNKLISFSNNFDWINGGLKQELINGVVRPYLRIKAGSQITMNYELFGNVRKGDGKTVKIIFKAENCRDYDAQVLSCKKDIKVVTTNTDEEILLVLDDGITLEYASAISIDVNGIGNLFKPEEAIFDRASEDSRKIFTDKFIKYENKFYKCRFAKVEDSEDQYYSYFYEAKVEDSFRGLYLTAQQGFYKSISSEMETQYCENSYIEFELDIGKQDSSSTKKNYLKFWIDGVPANFIVYDELDSFTLDQENGKTPYITIGSNDCDVCLYLLRIYDKGLKDDEHLQNFIVDGYNAIEIMNRFKRNDILDKDRNNIISPTKLALANPDCLVHVYTIDRFPKTKNDSIPNCSYYQYKNSDEAHLSAEGVTIKVQGTSSEKYVISAANLDSSFNEGFTLNGQHVDNWSMTDDAIGVNFFCTKVNVASCENANNALNQMWYNAFQPYKSVLKCKNPKARDTMQFTNGVLFIQDNNPNKNASDKLDNNVFNEIDGYVDLPSNQKYPRLYSLANMGNSKDNIEVFHDITNPLECCVEVKDNQTPQQWMTSDDFLEGDIDGGKKYYGFRYPDGAENATPDMIKGWMDFVHWMATSNPQPMYEAHTATNEKEFRSFAYNQKSAKDVDVFIAEYDDNEKYPRPLRYIQVYEFNPEINEYFTKTENKYGYTNLPLGPNVQKNYGNYRFNGYKAENQKKENGELWQKDYTPLIKDVVVTEYNYKNYITYEGDEDNKIIVPNGIVDANGYTHDTYEYRMAKMLHECEDHLVMDSIIYHYLFIERHCMIDNVAKNTFWSTEDGQVWNLIKDYDNDTSDGNDNNGKFTRTYGMEPMDRLNSNTYVFNARQAVWLNFIHGLNEAKAAIYQKLEEVEVDINGTKMKVWNKDHYLQLFKDWQDRIPERAWIEAYNRLYARPYEVYKERVYIPMMEGGKKTHQRTQYETYQDIYMSSEYQGVSAMGESIGIRGNGEGLLGNKLLIKTYSDCYVIGNIGGQKTSRRTKRNEESWVECPVDNQNNITYYIHPASAIVTLGDIEGRDGYGVVGDYLPEQIQISAAPKIRELILGLDRKGVNNDTLTGDLSFEALPLLEKVYASNFTAYEGSLDLSQCPSLKELDARNSSFTSVTIADGAPVTKIKLQNPTALKMTNLTNLEEFSINDYNRLLIVDLQNIDQSSGVNTKEILSSMEEIPRDSLIQYRLIDVDWVLDEDIDVDETDNTIPLIKYLLDNNTLETAEGKLEKGQSFTGDVYITSEAYDGNDAIKIYDKYVNSENYSNLDINFESDNSKLYKIHVYDGNGDIYWERRIQSGGSINNKSFFSGGPDGELNISKMLKDETATTIYEFLNKWEVVINNEPVGEVYWNEDGFIDYTAVITNDIYFYPIYNELEKLYTLNFYNEDGSKLLSTVSNAKYGDLLLNHYPNQIPYKADTADLDLEETYSFKGYSLFANGEIALPTTYTLTSWTQKQNFYAVFEKTNVYNSDNIYENYFNIDQTGILTTNKILSGKVTIPASVNNIRVTEIDGNAFRNNKNITHIFLQPGNTIKALGKAQGAGYNGSGGNYGCFAGCTNLKYFDFNNFNGEIIGNGAFFSCNLTNESPLNLTNKTTLTTLGSHCFNSGFEDYKTTEYQLNLPKSLTSVGEYAIANNNIKNFTITLGTPTEYLTTDIVTSNYVAFRDNSNYYLDIYYYCSAVSESLNDEEKTKYATYFGYRNNNSNALRTLIINGKTVVQEGLLQTTEGE